MAISKREQRRSFQERIIDEWMYGRKEVGQRKSHSSINLAFQPSTKKENNMKEEYSSQFRRWYDKDPVLSSAMKTLQSSDDETQISIALNLIKIIIEHNIENSEFEAVEDIISAVEAGIEEKRSGRWYDIDATLKTAMSMLQNCPEATQHVIAKEMAKLVVDKINEEE